MSALDRRGLHSRSSVDDIHRLTEQQEELLLHHLQRQGRDGGQLLMTARLRGAIATDHLATAWRDVVARHPALRSSVHWRDLPHPVQVVARTVELPIDEHDLRGVADDEVDRRLTDLRRKLRATPLDITAPPVARLARCRLDDDEHELIWACHHLLLDGWSCALVLREVIARLDPAGGVEPAPAPPFREYVAWSRRTAAADAVGYWKGRDLTAARRLAERGDGRPGDQGRAVRRLGRTATTELTAWCRQHDVTPSALLAGGWALALAGATDSERPMFAFTSSGRGAPVAGIEAMIGMFASTLLLDVPIDRDATPATWLEDVLSRQRHAQRWEHVALGRLLRAGGLSPRRLPFDSLLTFANFPGDDPRRIAPDTGVRLTSFRGDITSSWPLTVAVTPGDEIRIEARFAEDLLTGDRVDALLELYARQVEAIVGDRAATVAALLADAKPSSDRPPASARPVAASGAPHEPPANAIEAQLMRLWFDLIDREEVGRDESFFSVGGTSLLLAQLIERIREDFEIEIPIHVVFEDPTIRGLAEVIGARTPRRTWRSLVPIRSAGSELPWYFVHGLGGELSWLYHLAPYIDAEVPLLGLQAPPEPHDDLTAMAAQYLGELTAAGARGPFRLGGFCLGGCVAFEMAQQLTAAGESVELVAMIDTVSPLHLEGQSTTAAVQIARRLQHLLAKDPRAIVASIGDAARRAGRRLTASARGDDGEPRLDDVLDLRTLPPIFHEASRRHYQAMCAYRPQPYDGDVWLLRTRDPRFGSDYGWRPSVRGELHVEVVSGHHADLIVEPYVAELGRRLSAVVAALPRR